VLALASLFALLGVTSPGMLPAVDDEADDISSAALTANKPLTSANNVVFNLVFTSFDVPSDAGLNQAGVELGCKCRTRKGVSSCPK